MIRVVIADDELPGRERLKSLLEEIDTIEIVAETENGTEALEAIITHEPDAAFLDINMPGISVFTSIPSLQKQPLIIFQTAYSEHAVQAFEINALDYIMKPLRRERVQQAVDKITQVLNRPVSEPQESNTVDTISVKVNKTIKVLSIADIVRISFENEFSYIYTTEGKYISEKYLNYYENLLEKHNFFRASRSALVNLNHLSAVHTIDKGVYVIEFQDKSRIELSRRKGQLLKKKISF